VTASEVPGPQDLRTIPGWLDATDEAILRFVLDEQRRTGIVSGLGHEVQAVAGHPVQRVWARASQPTAHRRVVAAVTPPALLRLLSATARRVRPARG
jgi:hypothetical protein